MGRSLIPRVVVAAALAFGLLPGDAHAEGFIKPWFGVNMGSHPTATGSTFDNGLKTIGFSSGLLATDRPFGFDVDFGYAPSFFGESTLFGHNSVITLMGNVIVGPPIETAFRRGFRPFVTAGLGLIRSQNDGGSLLNFHTASNDLGFDVGGGVMIFAGRAFGIAGDVRYFRNVDDSSITSAFKLSPGGFHYWRSTVGIVLR